jgi:AcrR family transcriptional regulator
VAATAAELPAPTEFTEHEIKLIRGTYTSIARLGTQLSLRGISREIGVSPGLLVYHFGSHENLLLQTMTWALQSTVGRIRRHVREADARQHDAVTSLSALLDAVFVSPEENRDFYLVYLDLIQNSVRHSTFSGLAEVVRAHINGSYAVVIAAGVESGEFQVADVASAAREARSLVDGHVVQWLQRDDWRESHLLLHDDCLDSLRRLLRYEEAPQI